MLKWLALHRVLVFEYLKSTVNLDSLLVLDLLIFLADLVHHNAVDSLVSWLVKASADETHLREEAVLRIHVVKKDLLGLFADVFQLFNALFEVIVNKGSILHFNHLALLVHVSRLSVVPLYLDTEELSRIAWTLEDLLGHACVGAQVLNVIVDLFLELVKTLLGSSGHLDELGSAQLFGICLVHLLQDAFLLVAFAEDKELELLLERVSGKDQATSILVSKLVHALGAQLIVERRVQ